MRLQVLVTSMHQTDLSKIEQMHIAGPVLIANQAERYDYVTQTFAWGTAEMVTTPSRGLAKNRNIALECSAADAEYILFADDDMVFTDGYEALIMEEFARHPEAKAIKFNIYDLSQTRKIGMHYTGPFKKATRRNITASGVCALAVKREVIMRGNLHFNETFGAGTENYCGEDTIFLQEMVNKKIPLYLSSVEVAGIDQSESTWFEGRTPKYFRTLGMVIGYMYPKAAKLITVRSAYKFHKRRDCHLKFVEILRNYWQGIDSIKKGS